MNLKDYLIFLGFGIITILLLLMSSKIDNINRSVDVFDFDKTEFCD